MFNSGFLCNFASPFTKRLLHSFFSDMKVTKKRYLQGFFAVVTVLALVRCVFPDIAKSHCEVTEDMVADSASLSTEVMTDGDDAAVCRNGGVGIGPYAGDGVQTLPVPANFFNADGAPRKTRIYSVSSFKGAFPDSNSVQLAAAGRYGVPPVKDRNEAEHRMKELVYMGSNPYYHVDKLNNSIPYLVPRAAVLLQDIGRAYFDSLQMKGIPLHKIIVTSVLRTRDDVTKLRNRNGNATENSCHLYGTTFDICYNRYKTVEDPDGPARRSVRNDTLKWVLCEVLRDFREQGRCYIKYEVKQGCFHMTVN